MSRYTLWNEDVQAARFGVCHHSIYSAKASIAYMGEACARKVSIPEGTRALP